MTGHGEADSEPWSLDFVYVRIFPLDCVYALPTL